MIVGITGHRDFDKKKFDITSFLENLLIHDAVQIIAGGAPGFDRHITAICYYLNFKYCLYLPYPNFFWDKTLFNEALIVKTIDQFAKKDSYKKRNQKIVDDCDILFCYYDEKNKWASGTGQTVRMAERKGINVINFFK